MAPHLTVVILVKITENNFSRLFTWKRFRAADLKWTEVTHFQGSTGEQEDLSHQLSWPGHSSIQQPFWTKLRFAPFTVIRSSTGHTLLLVAVFKFLVLKSITGSTFHCSWAKSRSWAAGLVHSGDSIAQTNENLLMFMWEGMDTFYSSVSAD